MLAVNWIYVPKCLDARADSGEPVVLQHSHRAYPNRNAVVRRGVGEVSDALKAAQYRIRQEEEEDHGAYKSDGDKAHVHNNEENDNGEYQAEPAAAGIGQNHRRYHGRRRNRRGYPPIHRSRRQRHAEKHESAKIIIKVFHSSQGY